MSTDTRECPKCHNHYTYPSITGNCDWCGEKIGDSYVIEATMLNIGVENVRLKRENQQLREFIDDCRLFFKAPHGRNESAYWAKLKELTDKLDEL